MDLSLLRQPILAYRAIANAMNPLTDGNLTAEVLRPIQIVSRNLVSTDRVRTDIKKFNQPNSLLHQIRETLDGLVTSAAKDSFESLWIRPSIFSQPILEYDHPLPVSVFFESLRTKNIVTSGVTDFSNLFKSGSGFLENISSSFSSQTAPQVAYQANLPLSSLRELAPKKKVIAEQKKSVVTRRPYEDGRFKGEERELFSLFSSYLKGRRNKYN